MRRYISVALLCLCSLLLMGCPARWKVTFINGSEQLLSVRISGAPSGKMRSFTLPANAAHSELLAEVQSLAVFGPSGELLFQRDSFGTERLRPPLPGKYPHIYVLLTTTNAYVIPPEYSNTWGEHIDEIAKQGP